MPLRISIITPSFNQAAYLERAMQSVLDQGYPDLEYVVLDGGSTDGSREIIERYADRLAWWVSESDRGQTDALNKGLARITGEIVGFLNSDDYYLPGAFQVVADALQRSGASWLVGASRFVDGNSGETVEVWRPEPPPRRSRALWLAGPWGVPQPSSFWRRGVFERHGPFRDDMHYAFDTEHALRLALAGEMPEMLERELAVRFLHDQAKSANDAPFVEERRRIVELLADKLNRRERLELAARALLARFM